MIGPALALLASLACFACSPSTTRPESQDPAATAPPTAPITEPGLEVITWVTTADDRAFAAALAPFDAPVPDLPEADRARWREAGLRILHLPAKDAAALQAALSGPGSSQRQWLGQAFSWTPLVTGPDLPPRAFIATGADRLRLPSAPASGGALRMLTRCWVAPALAAPTAASAVTPAILSIELLPQHKEAIDPAALLRPASINALDAGMAFSRLAITLPARPAAAFVIVAEDPGVSWSDPAAPSEQAALPDAPLLGSAMLSGPPARSGSAEGPSLPARSRLIVLLLPRVPDRFTLAPNVPTPR